MKKSVIGIVVTWLAMFSSAFADEHLVSTRGILYRNQNETAAFLLQGTAALQIMSCKYKSEEVPAPPSTDGKEVEEYIRKYCVPFVPNVAGGTMKLVYQSISKRFVISTGVLGQEFTGSSCWATPGTNPCENPTPVPAVASSVVTMAINLADVTSVPVIGALVMHVSGQNPKIESTRDTFLKVSEATFLYPEIKEKAIQQ